MKKFTFAKIASLVFVCAMLLCALAVTTLATDEPTVEIVSNNVYFGEKYQLMYSVNAPAGAKLTAETSSGKSVKVVPFLDEKGNQVIAKGYPAYILAEGVAAQEIDEVITFTVEYNGETATTNYSVLQYVYERLNVKNIAVEAERAMFETFLAFADAANAFFTEGETVSFNDYVYVAAEGVTVNGVNPTGMYKAGDMPFANIDEIVYDDATQVVKCYIGEEKVDLDVVKAIVVADTAISVDVKVLDKCSEGHTWVDPTCQADGYCEVCTVAGEPAVDCKDENGDYKCDFGCGAVIEPEADSVLTLEQANALGKLFTSNNPTTNKYYVTGTIVDVYNTIYGNAHITDESGVQFTVYGMYDITGEIRYDALTYKPIAGDVITVYGQLGAYNGTAQMQNGWLDEVVAHECSYSEANCTDASVCTICNKTVSPALGHDYVDGVCSRCGHEEPVEGTTILPGKLTFSSAANKASADSYMQTNFPEWTISGKLGQTYAGYLGFGRSGDGTSSIKSSAIVVFSEFTITTVLKGNGSSGVSTSTLTFTLVDATGETIATGYANGSDTAAVTPADGKDTTYKISFTFVEGKTWTDVSNLVVSFKKATGNIGLKSLEFVQ